MEAKETVMTTGISPAKIDEIFWRTKDGQFLIAGLIDRCGPDFENRLCEVAVKQITEERGGFKVGHLSFVYVRVVQLHESLTKYLGPSVKITNVPKASLVKLIAKGCGGTTYFDQNE